MGPNYKALCSITFSQNQIDSTKKAVLKELLLIIEEHSKATGLSSGVRSLLAGLGLESRSQSQDSDWVDFNHAERSGVEQVFGEYLSDRINRTELGKYAVTLRMPRKPADLSAECFMFVEIHEEHVKEVAMALFNIRLDWLPEALQVSHSTGLVQTIASKHAIKGVSDEGISAVFGAQVKHAIDTCRVRVKEVGQGKVTTHCISMTVSGRKATASLTMGLMGGYSIQKALYAPLRI